jgi:hypothetical protein
MKAKEALYMVRVQLQDNEFNRDLFSVLERAVELYDNTDEIQSLDHLFGDVTGELDNLTLVDFDGEYTYTLDEAMEELGITEEDLEDYEDEDFGDELPEDVDSYYDYLIDNGYFSVEELSIIINVNGFSINTLNDCIYAKYGYQDLQQMLES